MLVLNRVRRLLLAAVLTASVLALACGSASAIRLVLSEPTFRAVWTPARFIVSGLTISCNVTLEGSIHSTSIAKVERSLIGYVTANTPALMIAERNGTGTITSFRWDAVALAC